MARVTIVLPTYGESGNIDEMLERIFRQFSQNCHVLIVDDHSGDSTATKVLYWQSQGLPVTLLQRYSRKGRGLAGREGFSLALRTGAEYIVEMDADLSHAPEDIPRLLSPLQEGKAHISVGSRFVPGGKIHNRSFLRDLISHFARWWIRLVTHLPLADPTSGFRAYRREALETLFREAPPIATGPEIVEEVAYKLHCLGFSFCEVAIHFQDRCRGVSKFNWRKGLKVFLFCALLPHLFGHLREKEQSRLFPPSEEVV